MNSHSVPCDLGGTDQCETVVTCAGQELNLWSLQLPSVVLSQQIQELRLGRVVRWILIVSLFAILILLVFCSKHVRTISTQDFHCHLMLFCILWNSVISVFTFQPLCQLPEVSFPNCEHDSLLWTLIYSTIAGVILYCNIVIISIKKEIISYSSVRLHRWTKGEFED